MSEEPKPTYTAREIVLELFPATPERLIPRPHVFQLHRDTDRSLVISDRAERELGRLHPVPTNGAPTTQLCCDLCGRTGTRHYLELLRAVVPGSQGRRFRYLTACRNTADCETRRWDDAPVRALLEPR